MELLIVPLFFKNNLNKTKNQKSGETHARIFKINFTATDGQTENSQKISLFQIFLGNSGVRFTALLVFFFILFIKNNGAFKISIFKK